MGLPRIGEADSLVGRFLAACDAYGGRDAIAGRTGNWTYQVLRARIFAIAQRLIEHGVSPGDRVVLGHRAREETVAGIFATLLVGGIYVPVSPLQGRRQVADIIGLSQPRMILTDASSKLIIEAASGLHVELSDGGLLNRPPEGSMDGRERRGGSLLFTSGSTGGRKGVLQSQENLVHHIAVLTDHFGIDAADIHSLTAPFIFDASTTDIYCCLLNGALLAPIDARERGPAGIADDMAALGVTVLHATPTLLRSVCADWRGQQSGRLRLVVIGGEPLFRQDLQDFRRRLGPECRIINGYGATETSGFVALHEVGDAEPAATIPIGKPPAGFDLSLIGDDDMPTGLGEICVESRYIAQGYWDAATQACTPFPSVRGDLAVRRYMTGDVGELTTGGNLSLRGRQDRVVKVRGYRTNLDDIEHALLGLSGVTHAAVTKSEAEVLKAYLSGPDGSPSAGAVREHLAECLPAYILPIESHWLDSMPLTVTGKIDRRALERLDVCSQTIGPEQATSLQSESIADALLRICGEILGVDRVQASDRFFDLGGSSIGLAQVHSRMQAVLTREVPLYRFYEFGTLGELAIYLEGSRASAPAQWLEDIASRMRRRADRTRRGL